MSYTKTQVINELNKKVEEVKAYSHKRGYQFFQNVKRREQKKLIKIIAK